MICWTHLYENPRRLTPAWGHFRIFAPEAYERVRTLQLVPILHVEALMLAAHFPICWRMQDGKAVLCVLRSLLADGQGHPVKPTYASGSLPLVLRAFPVIPTDPTDAVDEVWIDDIPADRPTDIGAPILMTDGRLSRGATQRIRAMIALRESVDMTRRLTEALTSAGLLEPWPLDFELSANGQRVVVEDLHVVRSANLRAADLTGLFQTFGIEAAVFFTAHRISLFRTSMLLQAARAAAASETRRQTAEPAA